MGSYIFVGVTVEGPGLWAAYARGRHPHPGCGVSLLGRLLFDDNMTAVGYGEVNGETGATPIKGTRNRAASSEHVRADFVGGIAVGGVGRLPTRMRVDLAVADESSGGVHNGGGGVPSSTSSRR